MQEYPVYEYDWTLAPIKPLWHYDLSHILQNDCLQKWMERIEFWCGFLWNKKIPPICLSASLCTFPNHWPNAATLERVKLLKIINLLNILWQSVAEEGKSFMTSQLEIAGRTWLSYTPHGSTQPASMCTQCVFHAGPLKSAGVLKGGTWSFPGNAQQAPWETWSCMFCCSQTIWFFLNENVFCVSPVVQSGLL